MAGLTPDQCIAWLAERQYSVFSRDQAQDKGHSVSAIKYRLATGRWRSVFRGTYLVAGAVLTPHGETMAATLATGGHASHRSAAFLWAIEDIGAPSPPEVVIAGRRGASVQGVRVHRPIDLPEDDLTCIGKIPVTTKQRTLCDLASVLDARALEYALDDALRRGLVSAERLLARAREDAGPGRCGLPLLRELLEDRVGKPPTESHLETRFVRANRLLGLLEDAGLPEPARQVEIRRPDGTFVARVDFAYPEAKLVIELEGWSAHSSRQAFEDDRERERELAELGWLVLPVTDRSLDRPADVMRSTLRTYLHRTSGAGSEG